MKSDDSQIKNIMKLSHSTILELFIEPVLAVNYVIGLSLDFYFMCSPIKLLITKESTKTCYQEFSNICSLIELFPTRLIERDST